MSWSLKTTKIALLPSSFAHSQSNFWKYLAWINSRKC